MPEINDTQLAGLNRFTEMWTEGAMTKKEAKQFIDQIAQFVVKLDKKQEQEIQVLRQAVQGLIQKVEDKFDISLGSLTKQMDKLFVSDRIKKLELDHGMRMKSVDERVAKIRDGQDGLPGPRGPQGLQGSPDTPGQIRDKLEQLKEGDRLDAAAIKGIKELIKKYYKEIMGNMRFGGSGSYGRIASRFISEAPSGTPNGSLKTFYLSSIAAPNSLILTVNGQVQRSGSSNEYTISDRTITFTDANKPQTGDTLWAFYSEL